MALSAMPSMENVPHREPVKTHFRHLVWVVVLAWNGSFGQSVSDIVGLIRKGQIQDARTILTRIEDARSFSEPSDTLLFLHGLLSTRGDSAAFFYERLVESYPESPYRETAFFRLAQLQYAQGYYQTAQRRFFLFTRDHPKSTLVPKAYFWVGLCFKAMGKLDSSYAWLRQTISRFPGSDVVDPARKELESLPISGDTEMVLTEPAKPGESIQYFCQTGAFSRQDNALLRKSFFESKGFSVHFRSKLKDGQTLYLIWIGPLETLEQARAMAESLKKKYGISCTVVADAS